MLESPDDMTARFDARYRIAREPVFERVERRVLGTDYGTTSYTTRSQADRLGMLLELAPGTLLLDVGSGAGWPGIYLAGTTGCEVVVTDVPLEGLRVAAARLRREPARGAVVAASGASLPFRAERFDAVISSDVLC